MKLLYFLPITKQFDQLDFIQGSFLVSKEKTQKLSCFQSDEDKKLSLYAELIVRMVICKELKIKNSDITFNNQEYNKPFLTNNTNFNFNLSHTKNAIAVSFADVPVGVDVEKITSTPNFKIAHRYFTNNEVNYIINSKTKKAKRFFEIWTRKEAYVKCLGKGLSIPLHSFDVLSKPLCDFFETFMIADNYISIFSYSKNPTSCIILSENTFIDLCYETIK